MQVCNPNDVKIYSLTGGKSLPEWISERKRRQLLKNDLELRRRIQLIQDFDMPAVSNTINVTADGHYIIATGIYKPVVRCYDVNQLSMKFERGLDSEVVKCLVLAEDYSKMVFLQVDRYIELHAQGGRWYRLRIPKFGRDLAYHYPTCELYCVSAGREIFRLNLELGRFMTPMTTDANSSNVCAVNPVHHLFAVGTNEGRVECWDPRSQTRVGVLDTAISSITQQTNVSSIPSVTALKFNGSLTMGVGTSTGQILVYDIRTDKPMVVKDHYYGLPIKSLDFHTTQDTVISIDSKICKLWNSTDGSVVTSIEPDCNLNDVCVLPDSGMIMMACESPKMLAYYIPTLGPAPKWCAFLDNLTEELEESADPQVYDDYKFVTLQELKDLGLVHLEGTNLLRAYMHGYFMDVRLYNKAKSFADPFAYEQYKKKKIREKIEEERKNRVRVKKLPKVNKDLAQKLLEQEEVDKQRKPGKYKAKTKSLGDGLLHDERFSAMFENTDFQVDEANDDYQHLNALVTRLDKKREERMTAEEQESKNEEAFDFVQHFQEVEGSASSDDNSGEESSDESEESSGDEERAVKEAQRDRKILRKGARLEKEAADKSAQLKPKLYTLKETSKFKGSGFHSQTQTENTQSLEERLADEKKHAVSRGVSGGKQMTVTFSSSKAERTKKRQQEAFEHHKERRKIRRSAEDIQGKSKMKPKFWMGKRVI